MAFTAENLSNSWIHELDLRPLNIEPRILPSLTKFTNRICVVDQKHRMIYFPIGADMSNPREVTVFYIFASGRTAYLINWNDESPESIIRTANGVRHIPLDPQLERCIIEAHAALNVAHQAPVIVGENGNPISRN